MIFNNKRPGEFVISTALAVLALFPVAALASTAANTGITSTVTVNFEDAAGNAQTPVTDSVTISVHLVASAPLLSSPADEATTQSTGVALSYTITGTANGPDTYDFTSADTPTTMSGSATSDDPSITLGGTTTAAAVGSGVTTITVPFDGVDDGVVNGLAAGDTIVIDPTGAGDEVLIDSIDESTGAATNTVTITLDAGTPTTAAHAYAVIIGERTSVTVTITTSTISSGGSGSHSIVTTATSQADGTQTTSQSTPTVLTVNRPVLSVSKFVRNMTTAAFNPAVADETVNGTDYYASGVSGDPGDTMEYLIVIDNSTGADSAENIVLSNPVPEFTSFVGGSVSLDPGTGTFGALNEASDGGDAAELDATGNGTIYVYAGAGGDDTPAGAGNGTGGSLQAGEISYVTFQVTID